MATLTSSLVVRLINNVSGPARAVSRSLLGIQRQAADGRNLSFGEGLSRSINRNERALDRARGGMVDSVAGFYALKAALGAPLNAAIGFEAAMSKVGAVSRASDDQLAAMTSTARELGAKTAWSASQAAQGMEFLSMAGFGVNEVIAAMPGMLDLASASGADLGRTADIASNILSGFGIEAAEMGRVGDVLTNTFTSSNTNLEMLGNTMAYVAPVAAAAGASIETAAAMAGKLGDAGIQGSQAGTALRAMFTRLSAPPKKAADAIERLGIQTKDASGNLRDVPTILAEMNVAMEGMGTAAKTETLAHVFGMEAASAATVLLGQAGTGALQEYTKSLYEMGSASRVAAKMNDNTQGALKRLSSAFESMSISIGNALIPGFTALIEKIIPVIGWIDKFSEANPALASTIVQVVTGLVGFKIAMAGLRFVGLLGRGGALSMLSLGFNTVGRASIGAIAAARNAVALQSALGAMSGQRIGLLSKIAIGMGGIARAIPGVARVEKTLGAISRFAWRNALAPLRWARFVPQMSWGRFIPSFRWASFLPRLGWGSAVSFLRWATFIPRLRWLSFLNPLRWASFIPSFRWASALSPMRWASYVPRIGWGNLAGKLSWRMLLTPLKWGSRLIPVIGWGLLAGELAWHLLIKPLGWDKYLPQIDWSSIAGAFSWDDGIPVIDWSQFISSFSWGEKLPSLNWSDLISKLAWNTFLVPVRIADFISKLAWKNIIEPLGWDEYLPDLDWLGRIKELSWGDLVPSISWENFTGGFSWPEFPDFKMPDLPSLNLMGWAKDAWSGLKWPSWPVMASISFPALAPMAWASRAFEGFSWPSLPSFEWPSLPEISLPEMPSLSLPSVDVAGWASELLTGFSWPSWPEVVAPGLPALNIMGWALEAFTGFSWPGLPAFEWPSWPELRMPSLNLSGWASGEWGALSAWPSWPALAAPVFPALKLLEWAQAAFGRFKWPSLPVFTWPSWPAVNLPDLFDAGREMLSDLLSGAKDGVGSMLEWVRGIPAQVVEAIGSINLANIIKWPEPPNWWKRLMGTDKIADNFTVLPEQQQQAVTTLQGADDQELPTAARIAEIDAQIKARQDAIQALEADLAANPMSENTFGSAFDGRDNDLNWEKEQLAELMEDQAYATARAEELRAAIQAAGDTEVAPEINRESIEAALAHARQLSAEIRGLSGGPVDTDAAVPLDGKRRSGGPVRRGGRYLVGEGGPEVVEFGEDGFVHNARDTAAMLKSLRDGAGSALNGAARHISGSHSPSGRQGGQPYLSGAQGAPDASQAASGLAQMLRAGVAAAQATVAPAQSAVPAQAASQGAASSPLSLTIERIEITGVEDVMDIADKLGDVLEERLSQMMRGAHSDGSI